MIDTSTKLDELVVELLDCDSVALDTEFIPEDTYYPQLGLIQIGWKDGKTALIDPVEIEDLTPLGRVLEDKRIVKVFHDPTNDLPILWRATGVYTRNVFDTQRAAGFVGLRSRLSLTKLLRALLDIDVSNQSETLSDWLQRPLTEEQEEYALSDVRFLLQAYRELLSRAHELSHTAWMQEEMALYEDRTLYEEDDLDVLCAHLTRNNSVTARQYVVLYELLAWRDQEARTLDIPRGRVLKDQLVMSLAQRQPESMYELSLLRSLKNHKIRRYGLAILTTIEKGLDAPLSEKVHRLANRVPDTTQLSEVTKDLILACFKNLCKANHLDQGLVAKRREIFVFLAGGYVPLSHGWRYSCVGKELQAVLRGERYIQLHSATGLLHLIRCESQDNFCKKSTSDS